MVKLTWKVVVLIAAVVLTASGAYAGYFHDQSIKGVYASLNPQIYQLQNNLKTRNAQVASLSTQTSNLQGQVTSLKSEVSNLQAQISTLNSQLSSDNQKIGQLNQQIVQLNEQITQLQQTVNQMQTQLHKMEAANMDGDFTFTGGGCGFFGGCSATLRGAWVNYGTQNARSVVITLTWSNAGSFIQNNTINAGVVAGQSIGLYPDTSYTLSSAVDHVDWSFSFTS